VCVCVCVCVCAVCVWCVCVCLLCVYALTWDVFNRGWLRCGHPPGRGRWHAPSSRHLRAMLSVCGRCSFGGLGCCSCRVCLCRCRGCCYLSVCVCVNCWSFYRWCSRATTHDNGNYARCSLLTMYVVCVRVCVCVCVCVCVYVCGTGDGGPALKVAIGSWRRLPPKHLNIFKGAPLRPSKPLSDQFPVRVCSRPLCI